jgi:signal transduction histidine kinase
MMKWFSNRYAYPLVVFAVLASAALQSAWLIQLFHAQQVQVKRDLEQAVSDASRINDYLSVVPGHENSENFRNFFLSPEWLQFKQAFTNMRKRRVASKFSADIENDSSIIDISLRIPNNKVRPLRRRVVRTFDKGETLATAMAADRKDMARMDSLVVKQFELNNLQVKGYHLLHNYDSGKPEDLKLWRQAQQADYRSQLYAYNLNFFFHSYQYVIPSLTKIVMYRMRYYLISSLLMLLLTGLAFYFLFRMMRSQQLYTHARLAFTGNMTHELKTPVAIIDAALDAITRYQLTHDPVKLDNYVGISKVEIQRLNQIIDKVLNLDQLDNGGIRLNAELYDVQQGLEGIVTSMRLSKSMHTAVISFQPSEEPCFVYGDPVHLSNVFYNLIDNALKYSGKDASVVVSCRCDHEHVIITVADNGPGIPKMYQEQIFERFFRVTDHADIHNVKGSGLGLYYVRQIISLHQGSIRIQSSARGSLFIIYLPAYHEV